MVVLLTLLAAILHCSKARRAHANRDIFDEVDFYGSNYAAGNYYDYYTELLNDYYDILSKYKTALNWIKSHEMYAMDAMDPWDDVDAGKIKTATHKDVDDSDVKAAVKAIQIAKKGHYSGWTTARWQQECVDYFLNPEVKVKAKGKKAIPKPVVGGDHKHTPFDFGTPVIKRKAVAPGISTRKLDPFGKPWKVKAIPKPVVGGDHKHTPFDFGTPVIKRKAVAPGISTRKLDPFGEPWKVKAKGKKAIPKPVVGGDHKHTPIDFGTPVIKRKERKAVAPGLSTRKLDPFGKPWKVKTKIET